MKKKRTVILLRGTNEQIAEQSKELQADCEKRDWSVIKIYENHGKIGEPLCSNISVGLSGDWRSAASSMCFSSRAWGCKLLQ